jgi:hypothetical protein
LFDEAGLECVQVGTYRHRVMGEADFYRATRPA